MIILIYNTYTIPILYLDYTYTIPILYSSFTYTVLATGVQACWGIAIEHERSSVACNYYSCSRYAGRLAGFARRHKGHFAKRGGHAAGRCAEHGRALPRCGHSQGPTNVCNSTLKPCTALSCGLSHSGTHRCMQYTEPCTALCCGLVQAVFELVLTIAPARRVMICLVNLAAFTLTCAASMCSIACAGIGCLV